ncbi:hypothetical protein KBX73_10035 [Acetobacter persici]|uniref:hypothetical protein n=1 Tax=Acetobacter persici TaxID=1076596 RepID=UPI0020CE822D|nr:hypothetical protein [Acetobacter persici]MCP9320103.1 hypothetical protein [Acetobacter persici]
MSDTNPDTPTVSYGTSSDPVVTLSVPADASAAVQDDKPTLPKNAAWQADGSVLLTLRQPVVQNGFDQTGSATTSTVTAVSFRPFTGAAMLRIQAQKNDAQRGLVMMQESSGLTGPVGEDVFRKMDARDFIACTVIASLFTDPGL